MDPPFFVVWRKQTRPPKLQHATSTRAENEAARLALRHPGEEFFVLAPIAAFFRPAPDPDPPSPGPRAPWGSITRGRARGGYARAAALTPERRREIAREAAEARWRSVLADYDP